VKPRLLVVELHHLGDAVMSLPFLRGAATAFEIHVICRPDTTAVYRLLPDPPLLLPWTPPWDTSTTLRQTLHALRAKGTELRTHAFNHAACAWADARAAILMAATGAPRRIGFPMTRANYYAARHPWRARRLLLGRLLERAAPLFGYPSLLTTALHRRSPSQHHLECWNLIASALGIQPDHATPWFPATPTPLPRPHDKPLLAFHRHARLPTKQWPMEKWDALLADPALQSSHTLVELLPPGATPHPAATLHLPTPDLPTLASAIASCDALLCHDSLPAHLAAALGKPVATIFGSGNPDWFAPWRNQHLAIRKPVCPLHPCIDRCGMDRVLCLDAIQPADVLATLRTIHTPPPPSTFQHS
jgi:ADP-heptose:LPS heptosyltransferase